MLVLSRQKNETIMIGDDIEITVVDVRGDKVRIGIVAPKSVAVHRKEIYLAIREENIRAAAADTDILSGAADIMNFPPPAPATPPPAGDKPKPGGRKKA